MSVRTVQTSAIAPRHTAVAARGQGSSTPWIRNPSWVSLPTVGSTDQKFVGLLAIFPDSTFAALSATTSTGTYTVDWGDGTSPQTYTSATTANYQYNYSASGLSDTPVTFTASTSVVNRTSHGYTNGMLISFATIITTTGIVAGQSYYVVNATANTFQVSATSGGSAIALANDGTGTILPYKMAIVTVTPTTSNLTALNLNIKNTTSGLSAYETGWLDIAVGSPNFSAFGLQISSGSLNINYTMLEQVSITNLGSQTSLSSMFNGCRQLRSVNLPSTASINTTSSMFQNCSALQTVPLFNTAAVTNMSSMFSGCYSLTSVPLFNTAAVTNMGSMFSSCSALQTVPLFNTAAVTNMPSMFSTCYSLTSVPLFNTALVGNMASMFSGCSALQTVPLFNTVATTSMSGMFNGCYSLASVPLFNTAAVTNMSLMFTACYSLTSVPLFNTAAVTNMAGMFSSCSALENVPLFNIKSTGTVDLSSMFNGCFSLQTVPLLNTTVVTNMNSMLQQCIPLQTIPAWNCTGVTSAANFTTIFNSCPNISRIDAYNFKFSFSISGLKLSQTAIETVFNNLFPTTGQTITVGSNTNFGAPAVISLSGTTTAGSAIVAMASTTGLTTGMEIAATGISSAVAVTIQASPTNTITLNNHGIANGTLVSFATIVTTTGIVVNTPYYVVNSTTNTFQVALTSGGAAITLTGNGSGTILYGTTITSITPNTSITLSIPASASGTVTTTSALLRRSYARLRGWTVA